MLSFRFQQNTIVNLSQTYKWNTEWSLGIPSVKNNSRIL